MVKNRETKNYGGRQVEENIIMMRILTRKDSVGFRGKKRENVEKIKINQEGRKIHRK